MSTLYIQRFLVLLALGLTFQFSVAQERAKIVDMPDLVKIDVQQATAEDVDWGDLTPGTMVRCRISVENTEEKPMTLVRVLSDPGCFTSGITGPLRDVKLQPGETVDFFLITSVQEPGQYSLKNTLIVEIDETRYRRAAFNYQGFVNEINGDF